MDKKKKAIVLEVLVSCKIELESMEQDIEEYISSGRLMEQIENAITIMEEA